MTANVDENSGAAPILESGSFRTSVWIRHGSGDRATLGFDSAEDAGDNVYLEEGDFLIIGGSRARAAIYAVCSAGETATLLVDAK